MDFSLFQPNLINMNVHSATFRCSIELYVSSGICTLADFFPNWDFRGVFSIYNKFCRLLYVPLPSVYLNSCLQYNKQFKYKKRRIRREI
jgi:hypothetical protein